MDAGMDMDQMDGAMEMDMGMGGEEAHQPEQPPPEQQEPPAAEQQPPAMEEAPAEGGG